MIELITVSLRSWSPSLKSQGKSLGDEFFVLENEVRCFEIDTSLETVLFFICGLEYSFSGGGVRLQEFLYQWMELKPKIHCWARRTQFESFLWRQWREKKFNHISPWMRLTFPSWGTRRKFWRFSLTTHLMPFSQNLPTNQIMKKFSRILVQKKETQTCKPTQLGMGKRETSRRKRKRFHSPEHWFPFQKICLYLF